MLSPPPGFPINRIRAGGLYQALLQINAYWLMGAIRRAVKQLNLHKPIVVNAFNPSYGPALRGKLDEQLCIYYAYDEIAAARWVKKHGLLAEQTFCTLVDGVVVSSPGLLEKKQNLHPRIAMVPNGVDFDRFHRAYALRKGRPKRPSPTIGYIGS
ncbi:MAG: glycosyltransferase family 1 protein, partial [Bacteroidia bacterium]|nr:glycosyltransferase family 1 protein [Bacteroidia bacterium]